MFKFKKKKKKNTSIYLTYNEFKKLATERDITKDEQFLLNYYRQLSNKRGLNEKEALHALNCIIINDAESQTNDSNHNNIDVNNNHNIDITNTKTLNKFIQYISDRNHIKFVFLKVLTNSSNNKHLDINSIGTFIYELIVDFFKNKCLCKRNQIPSYNLLLSFITSIKTQLSYFNDNRNVFSLGFLTQYLPLIVIKFNKNKHEIKHENKVNEIHELMQRMQNIDGNIMEYQHDISDIIDDLKVRTNKLKSHTYPEQIDELNNVLNELRKQIEILAEDLTKVENEQLSAERFAEEIREKTLQKETFNINHHIQSVMDQNIDDILGNTERRGSTSKSQSHTIDSHMASTSIRKPFFVRPLGFDVNLDVDDNELYVCNVSLESQAHKLKVCCGWRVAMVGREDRVSVMYHILKDANQQTNDDDNALPLFITFQVSNYNRLNI